MGSKEQVTVLIGTNGFNGIGRRWLRETGKKKLRNMKDDFKMVKTSFSGDGRVTVAMSMQAREFMLNVSL